MPDDINPVLTDDRIVEIARALRWQVRYDEIKDNALELARAVEREVLRVLADREGRQPIPVSDRLPESGQWVLAWWPEDDHGVIAEGWGVSLRDGIDWQHSCGATDGDLGVTPSHWQPMPAPPADAQRAKGDAS